jgi:hypothetical protein
MQMSCKWQALMACRKRRKEEDKGKKEKYL